MTKKEAMNSDQIVYPLGNDGERRPSTLPLQKGCQSPPHYPAEAPVSLLATE